MMIVGLVIVPGVVIIGFGPFEASAALPSRTIVFDMSHGQYEDYIFDSFDTWMEGNLTAMGYDVVFAFGGINDTILANADALLVGSINHEASSGVTPFVQAEYDAISDWYATGHKFLWVGADSDFGGGAWKTSNVTQILSDVGSHIYPEPTTISDGDSFAGASYRPVANITSDDAYVAELVENVNKVLVHSPTLIYGSTSATEGQDAVDLETGSVDDVYPVLYFFNGTIGDQDLTAPYAHTDGTFGQFVAMAVEVNAGSAGTGVIAVSGGPQYGSHAPMYADTQSGRTDLDGYNLVLQTIEWGIRMADYKGKVVFDMSHGQYEDYIFDSFDTWMERNLTLMGYEVVFAFGGINASVLAGADALLVGSINHEASSGVTPFAQAEYDAIEDWYELGHKFLWVSADSDFGGGAWKTANVTPILSAVGSHIYPEPTTISDGESFAGASYRPVANITSDDAFVADLVADVTHVLVHSPTLIYGSTSATDGADAVDLETGSIENVYPVLYFFNGTIGDQDLTAPYAHTDGTFGEFVAMAVEVEAGITETGVIAVSGGPSYGSHAPMYADTQSGRTDLDGYNLVLQTIEWGIDTAINTPDITPTPTTTTTPPPTTTTEPPPPPPIDPMLLLAVGVGALVVIVLIVIVVRKR
jgi:hypothetical protein